MKLFCTCMFALAGVATLQAEEPCLTFVVHSPNTNTRATAPSKKNNQNTTILLQALAQSCNQLGQVINAPTQTERQQGILNLIGTVLATAAELSNKNNKNDQKSTKEMEAQLPGKLTRITDLLLSEYTRMPIKEPLPATLTLLNSIPDQAQREALVSIFLTNPNTRNQYLDDLFNILTTYVLQAVPNIMQHVKEMILQWFSSQTTPTTHTPSSTQQDEQPTA